VTKMLAGTARVTSKAMATARGVVSASLLPCRLPVGLQLHFRNWPHPQLDLARAGPYEYTTTTTRRDDQRYDERRGSP
jgi:hypothetical protein